MRKHIYIALFLSLFVYSKEAYAVFDIMAKVESALEQAQDIKKKITAEYEKIKSTIIMAKQGFEDASCFKNPLECDLNALMTAFDAENQEAYMTNLRKSIPLMPGVEKMNQGDLHNKDSEGLEEDVDKNYVYKRGKSDDLLTSLKYMKNMNTVAATDTETLFAKGIVTRHSIEKEDNPYPMEFKNDNIDEVLRAQNTVGILTQSRLARIVELRSWMVSGQSTIELVSQSNSDEDDEEE